MIPAYIKNDFKLHQPLFPIGVHNYQELLVHNPFSILFYEFTSPGHDSVYEMYNDLSCIPSGCMDVLFITGSRKSCMEFVGTTTQLQHIKIFPGSRYFGVRLAPGMFLSYNEFSLRDTVNRELFFNGDSGLLRDFFQKLQKIHFFHERIDLFYHYFYENLNYGVVGELTQFMISEINSSRGSMRISQLAEDMNYSERHISRIFQDNMGISPKSFSRIIRFQYAVDFILTSSKLTIGDYIYELGYSDQAHFQREFKQYTGTTPITFRHYIQ